MNFEWDSEKAEHNERKHGVTLEEATIVFFDTFAHENTDESHGETRFQRIGLGANGILYVVYTTRGENEESYRLISARKATRNETIIYFELRR